MEEENKEKMNNAITGKITLIFDQKSYSQIVTIENISLSSLQITFSNNQFLNPYLESMETKSPILLEFCLLSYSLTIKCLAQKIRIHYNIEEEKNYHIVSKLIYTKESFLENKEKLTIFLIKKSMSKMYIGNNKLFKA